MWVLYKSVIYTVDDYTVAVAVVVADHIVVARLGCTSGVAE